MPLLDFEDSVRIVAPDGTARRAQLTGAVETANPLEANLGHGETALAFQRWLQVQVTTPAPLDFTQGSLIFADGSRRTAQFSPKSTAAERAAGHPAGKPFVYGVKFTGG